MHGRGRCGGGRGGQLLTNQALYLGRNRQVIQYAETALRGARGSLSAALGDLTAARACAQQSVDAAAHSHTRGRVHRLATLATVLAGQGDAEHAAGTAVTIAGPVRLTGQERHERTGEAIAFMAQGFGFSRPRGHLPRG